jgi:hypothetical protein
MPVICMRLGGLLPAVEACYPNCSNMLDSLTLEWQNRNKFKIVVLVMACVCPLVKISVF